MEEGVMISRTTFSAIFSPMVSGQAQKTGLPFFGELPAVIQSFVMELLAEPHTMIKILTERRGRLHGFYSIPDYSSMDIPHPTKIWVLWCSWWSKVFGSFLLSISATSISNLVFKPVSQSCD